MKKITRKSESGILAGVCSGFADFLSIDVTVVRVVWVIFTLFGGSGILAYLLGILLIPEDSKKSKKEGEDIKCDTDRTIWYIVLIAVGIFTIIQYNHVIEVLWDTFWGSGFNILAAIILIIFGVYFFGKRREKVSDEKVQDIRNQLHLSVADKKIFGVCGGIGETFDIDTNLVRYLWVLGTFMSAGIGILAYFVLGMMLPKTEKTGDSD